MVYEDTRDLPRRTVADKVLRDKAFSIAKNPKYDGYERDHTLKVCKFFDKKTLGDAVESKIISNQELTEELHKPIIRKIGKRKVHSFERQKSYYNY